jgi:DNA ligase-1
MAGIDPAHLECPMPAHHHLPQQPQGPVAAPALRRRHLTLAAVAAWALPGAAAHARGGSGASGAVAPLLAREWPQDADPAGFLVSEKLDGVRALWDGRVLRFRSGAVVQAPRWFLARLPAQPLDGELWIGPGRFETLVGTVRHQRPDDSAWRPVRYQVFELPGAGGSFAQRAPALAALCRDVGWPALQALPQQPVADRAALQRRLDTVLAAGGEGLVLHRADAPVASGRGPWLYKHKPLHDAEATVTGHLAGQGRLAGLTGALQVRTDAGVALAIGTGLSDADRAHPPAVGERISFTHRGLTAAGVPRFASYLRRAPQL